MKLTLTLRRSARIKEKIQKQQIEQNNIQNSPLARQEYRATNNNTLPFDSTKSKKAVKNKKIINSQPTPKTKKTLKPLNIKAFGNVWIQKEIKIY